ncbi:MAG: nucleoside phosphorylase [Anaerolineae bacterium]|nr:nucleoside phosphorylase [Anaerolineae bacterium]
MSEPTLYLKCTPDDVAPLVLLSGDPARVDRIAAMLSGAREISRNREFAVATGAYLGIPITAASGGIGAPSTAIAVHELAQVGARAIVRIGTMMGITAPMGTVVLSTGAVRGDGTSPHYLPLAYPALPDWTLVHTLAQAGRDRGLDVALGLTSSHDAFYPEMAPTRLGDAPLDLTLPAKIGVLGMDMEAALLFVLGRMLGLATAAMCLITVNAEPHTHMDLSQRAERDAVMVRAALDGLVAFGAA